jgi:hypothetical protein
MGYALAFSLSCPILSDPWFKNLTMGFAGSTLIP